MAYNMQGTIKLIQDAETFASGFTKRVFVLTVEDGKYPQDICLETLQDKVSILDDLNEGDVVDAKFDIRGREYNGRYFNNLVCWAVESIAAGKPTNEDAPHSEADRPKTGTPDEFDDDIPF